MSEAFVYIWYDALNKMYYLGSSIGKDPNYAHSSFVMESFTMKTKPSYMHRKILGEGTHDEMLALESELQANRKERCWDRYYNQVVCDGVYGGFGSRENNPKWKGGIKVNDPKAYMKTYKVAWNQSPEGKASRDKWNQSPKGKATKKKWNQSPEGKVSKKKYSAKLKAETGYTCGYSRAKKKAEAQGEGPLAVFMK
jgi:hypothetical protein